MKKKRLCKCTVSVRYEKKNEEYSTGLAYTTVGMGSS